MVPCTGNSTRSQMAQGYWQQFAGDRAEVPGAEPHGLNPKATDSPDEVMATYQTVCDEIREFYRELINQML